MSSIQFLAQIASSLAFFFYGIGCFYSPDLVAEFDRYGLARLRTVIGALQIAGALGLAAGFFFDPLRILCAACFVVMMFFALFVRAKIGDPLVLWLPALGLLVSNLFVALPLFKE